MQKWPYAELAHIDVQYFRSMPKKNDPGQKWEHLTIEAIFVSEDTVMFFDHYAKEYKRRRSEIDEYLEKLGADGWKLTTTGTMLDGKGYQFRRYQFRRAM
jgi:hypothetical protein